MQSEKKLAVLIDADNAKASAIAEVLNEIAKYGTANVKRVYGNWTSQYLGSWKEVLHEHSLQPRQQFAHTAGKNATDIAMVIDAMDLLHSERFDGFCLVSSDSDFTPLASRIREAGLKVYGIGERDKTPKPFVAACDKFIFTEILNSPKKEESTSDLGPNELLRKAVEAASDDDGWARLGSVGNSIAKMKPEFDSRNYGHTKLSALVKATGLFEVKNRTTESGHSDPYIKLKKRS